MNETKPSITVWDFLQGWIYQVFQYIDIRLALLVGLMAFMVAVNFDAAGNPAVAADMASRSAEVTTIPSVTVISRAQAFGSEVSSLDQAIDAKLATAQRLRHGTLTSAVITSSRLTRAHFFTDLPSR